MWRKWMLGLVVGVLAVSLGFFAVRPALAATPAAPAAGYEAHRGWGGRFCGQAGLEAAAEALGMTADELSAQLWGGKTLADLAEEKGVDLQTVRDAVLQACEQALRDAIEQAVQDGRISREMADWLLQGLDQGFWGPRATNHFWGWGHPFGHGWGRGPWGKGFQRGGPWGKGRLPAPQPTPTPSSGSGA